MMENLHNWAGNYTYRAAHVHRPAAVVVVSREQHGDQFQGAVVGLGGLGVITKLTLDLVPMTLPHQTGPRVTRVLS